MSSGTSVDTVGKAGQAVSSAASVPEAGSPSSPAASTGVNIAPTEPSGLRRRRDDDDKWPVDDPDDEELKVDPQTGLRRGKRIIKTVTAAILLFTVGSIMLWLGIKNLNVDKDRAVGMIVVGSLAFLPGSYATFILIGAWCRWDGYRYSDLPSYDD